MRGGGGVPHLAGGGAVEQPVERREIPMQIQIQVKVKVIQIQEGEQPVARLALHGGRAGGGADHADCLRLVGGDRHVVDGEEGEEEAVLIGLRRRRGALAGGLPELAEKVRLSL